MASLFARLRAAALRRDVELQQMSPSERRFATESLEDRQADIFVEQELGGIDPNRLLEDDHPRHES
ncbi:MAG: hypothetical protein JO064_04170 [Actinobacteria bacterium]|nr:hypothetical protein [Actinomycetota bacterium]MBV8597825.1 hypothetical protein [Actinomycetota bacterium]